MPSIFCAGFFWKQVQLRSADVKYGKIPVRIRRNRLVDLCFRLCHLRVSHPPLEVTLLLTGVRGVRLPQSRAYNSSYSMLETMGARSALELCLHSLLPYSVPPCVGPDPDVKFPTEFAISTRFQVGRSSDDTVCYAVHVF